MENETEYYNVKVTLSLEKKVKEQYLVNAVSCTDAEAIVTEDFANAAFEFEVTGVTKTSIVKVLGEPKENV